MNYRLVLWSFHLTLLLCLFLNGTTAASAAEEVSADRLLRVPLYFITDRNLQPSKNSDVHFGPHRKYINDCKHDPYMGTAYCVVENVDNKPLTNHLQELGWAKAEPKDKVGAITTAVIGDDNFEKVQTSFYDTVKGKALLTDDKNLLMFAHGYNMTFVNAARIAADLAYNSERPLIFYSWPSVGKLRSYDTDEANVEWSQEHFNDMVLRLEKMCTEDSSIKVRLVAHSMGNRLVVRATPLLREKPYVLEAALICPDVDDGIVQHYIKQYISPKGTAILRIYMSRYDKALPMSQLLHGGYTRLGEQADALGGWVAKTLTTKADGNVPATKAEDNALAKMLAENRKRMQTIDFTNIDSGFIGHTVPAKLVCNMSFTNAPPAGLEFDLEKSGLRSGLSNFFTKVTKLKPTSEDTLAGDVLHVVRVRDIKTKDAQEAEPQISKSKSGNI